MIVALLENMFEEKIHLDYEFTPTNVMLRIGIMVDSSCKSITIALFKLQFLNLN